MTSQVRFAQAQWQCAVMAATKDTEDSRISFNFLVIVVCIYSTRITSLCNHLSLAYCTCSRVHTMYILDSKKQTETPRYS